jgi:hypothetical protein
MAGNPNRPPVSELVPIPKPGGRFNNWGERKWITVSSEKQQVIAQKLSKLELSPRARELYRAAKFTDSTGVEFVFISNAQFPTLVLPESGLHLVPCFAPLDPINPKIEDRQAAMMKWGQFIYDGWLPNEEWTPYRLDEIVSFLDDFAALFSIVGTYYAYWEPKYLFSRSPVPSYLATQPEFQSLVDTIAIMDSLPPSDRQALGRSVAWIANALRTEPVQRFLLLFVSIESLATYIESDKTKKGSVLRSVFAADKPSKSERKRIRDACIEKIFAQGPVSAKTVEKAYLDCIYKSVRDRLEDHLDRVFGDDGVSRIIFKEEVGGKTLWQLRNDIAHGDLSLLSEKETRFLSKRVGVLEGIARDYLRTVFATLTRVDYFSKPRRPVLTLPLSQAIGSPGTEYEGPTDMAEYYANVELLSSSYVRVTF